MVTKKTSSLLEHKSLHSTVRNHTCDNIPKITQEWKQSINTAQPMMS